MHSLLKRQLSRLFGDSTNIPRACREFVDVVEEAYREFDADRGMLERSLDLSSQELVGANSETRAIFRAIPDLVLRFDRAGLILDIKGAGAGDLLIARRQFVGRQIEDSPLRPAAQQFLRAIGRVAAEKSPANFEYATEDQQAWFEARLVPLPGEQVLAIRRNITERKHAERENAALLREIRQLNAELEQRVVERTEALRQQEALFQAAADQAPQVMWILNPKGAVTYLNRSWYDLVGGAPPRWCGHEWAEVVLPEDVADMRAKWAAAKEGGALFAGTRRVRAVDGTWHTLAYRTSPVFDRSGKIACWIGMDADITEIKAIEADLRWSNRELEAFSYSVSHDLRAPLDAIDGFSKILGEQLGSQDTAKLHHYVSRIHCGVLRMAQMIDSLLALAQVSRTRLEPKSVNLSELAASILVELQSRNPDRSVSVNVEPDIVVEGDAGMLALALENLLANAWKFTSRRANAKIAVGRCTTDGPESTFYVSDNGAGFDMAYGDKLFETFQRLHSIEEFPGTGVGLATVRRIVARHGGRVWAEAQPDKGATFFVALPDSAGTNAAALFNRKNDSRFGPLGQ